MQSAVTASADQREEQAVDSTQWLLKELNRWHQERGGSSWFHQPKLCWCPSLTQTGRKHPKMNVSSNRRQVSATLPPPTSKNISLEENEKKPVYLISRMHSGTEGEKNK